ncbi:MAG: hypothetical protein RL556_393, partial [Actinomycetota bacterium]
EPYEITSVSANPLMVQWSGTNTLVAGFEPKSPEGNMVYVIQVGGVATAAGFVPSLMELSATENPLTIYAVTLDHRLLENSGYNWTEKTTDVLALHFAQ